MVNPYLKIDLLELCVESSQSAVVKKELLARLALLELTKSEEFVLTKLFPPNREDMVKTLELYDRLTVPLRNSEIKPWRSLDQLIELRLSKELLQSGVFAAQIIRSLYIWYIENNYQLVKEFLHRLENYSNGSFAFNDVLDDEWGLSYSLVANFLIAQFFPFLPLPIQTMFVTSPLLKIALQNGFDVDGMLEKAIHQYYSLDTRREMSLSFAALLYNNKTPIGKGIKGEEVAVRYWIDSFRRFCDESIKEEKLDLFFSGKNLVNCTEVEKGLVEDVVTFYTYLVAGIYNESDVDRDKVNQEISRAKKKNSKLGISSSKVIESDGVKSLILDRHDEKIEREVIKKWIENEGDPLIIKRDLFEVLSDVDWTQEPVLSNVLLINEIYEKTFGQEYGPLIYFDEEKKLFVLNK